MGVARFVEIWRRGTDNGTHEGRRPRGRTAPICSDTQSVARPYAETPIRFFYEAGTIGAAKLTLVPATNKAAAQYTSQSVTTGLIAGSDLVIVSISGVIKKYK
jgi:hypothetical protein